MKKKSIEKLYKSRKIKLTESKHGKDTMRKEGKRIPVDMDSLHDAIVKMLSGEAITETDNTEKMSNLLDKAYKECRINRFQKQAKAEKLIDSESTLFNQLQNDDETEGITLDGVSIPSETAWMIDHIREGLKPKPKKSERLSTKNHFEIYNLRLNVFDYYFLQGLTVRETGEKLKLHYVKIQRIINEIRNIIDSLNIKSLYSDMGFAEKTNLDRYSRSDKYRPLEIRFPEIAEPSTGEMIDISDYQPQKKSIPSFRFKSLLKSTAGFTSCERIKAKVLEVNPTLKSFDVLLGYDVKQFTYGLRPQPVMITIKGNTDYGDAIRPKKSRNREYNQLMQNRIDYERMICPKVETKKDRPVFKNNRLTCRWHGCLMVNQP